MPSPSRDLKLRNPYVNWSNLRRPHGEGLDRCLYHQTILIKKLQRRAADAIYRDANRMTQQDDFTPTRGMDHLIAAFNDGRLNQQQFMRFADKLIEYAEWNLWILGRLGPVRPYDPPLGELHELALDNQNVHTAAVTKQTRKGVDLLVTTVAGSENTLEALEAAWVGSKPPIKMGVVLKDMRKWYICKDVPYRKALDGLWTRVQKSLDKDDLIERMWEECLESVDMCCEGHLSRLANVLCGYDLEFKAPVSVGQLLQERMAAIAESKKDLPDKMSDAWAVFEELAIPVEERGAWVEAL
jgi:hypothetical protein